jgi:DnaJ-class molecular chaperone
MANSFECFKCGGKGKIEAFSHIENGDCFQCGGTGRLMTREQRAQRAKEIAAKHERDLEVYETKLAKGCGLTLKEYRHIADPKRYPREVAA